MIISKAVFTFDAFSLGVLKLQALRLKAESNRHLKTKPEDARVDTFLTFHL